MPFDAPSADLEAIVRQSSDVITVVDEDGTVRYGSPAIERVLGYEPTTLVGERAIRFVHPADRDDAVEVFEEGSGDDVVTAEFRFRHADGSWVYVEAVGSAADDAAVGGYVVNSRPVTDRTAATRERAAVLERMTDAFYALDPDWRFTFVNDRAETLLRRDADELVGEVLWEAFPEARTTILGERFREAMATQETVSFEVEYEPLGGTFEVQAYPSDTGLTVYFRDVTERRRVEAELATSVDALHRLYVVASDTDHSFEEKQSRILELGQSYLDLPYAFVTRVADGEQHIVAARGDHDLLQVGESCSIERSYCRRTVETDGILAVFDAVEAGWADDPAYETFELGSYVGGKLVVDGELYGTLCFAATAPRERSFTDSERTFVELASRWLAYELEHRRYQAELEARNEQLQEFARFVSHDLRNPLNVAAGRLERARADRDDDDLAAVADAHDRMAALIDDLLTLARYGEDVAELEPVGLAAAVEDCWATVETGDATLVADADRVVRADDTRLRQLLENLFGNAVEHGSTSPRSPAAHEDAVEHGSTSNRPSADDAVEHGGDGVTVTVGLLDGGFFVADDGPGIPPAKRDAVFERGYSTTADGTGFGLRIVDLVAEAHGWDVTVVEGDDGGARFEVTGVEFVD